MRNAVAQGNNAYNNSVNTAADLGADASGISATLTPFLTEEMLHPEGLGQSGIAAETGAAMGGAGGATAGLTGQAVQRAAASRNAGGVNAALDAIARERTKANANSSENIEAGNEQLKQKQMQEGAQDLNSMYGTDTSGMLKAESLEPEDINAETNAGKSGWYQNTIAMINALKPGPGGGGGGGG
jgi:hypothetical protein